VENLPVLLESADALIVTTPVLKESLASAGKPVHVLPNAVDPDDWKPRPVKNGPLRVGWTGSSSHIEDLQMLVPGLLRAREKIPFDFVIQGLVDMPIREQAAQARSMMDRLEPSRRATARAFLDLADSLDTIRYTHVPFGETGRFFEILPALDLDIGLCPLLDTEFNRHKSANKFYEYAVTGTVTLASDVTPYRGEVSAVVSNDPHGWAEGIDALAKDRRLRRKHLERQREFVLERRNIHRLRENWRAALEAVLSGDRSEVNGGTMDKRAAGY
jgi:glycosyltransferase involved in cell wall biosynthesis